MLAARGQRRHTKLFDRTLNCLIDTLGCCSITLGLECAAAAARASRPDSRHAVRRPRRRRRATFARTLPLEFPLEMAATEPPTLVWYSVRVNGVLSKAVSLQIDRDCILGDVLDRVHEKKLADAIRQRVSVADLRVFLQAPPSSTRRTSPSSMSSCPRLRRRNPSSSTCRLQQPQHQVSSRTHPSAARSRHRDGHDGRAPTSICGCVLVSPSSPAPRPP